MFRKQILVNGIEVIQDRTKGLTPKLLVAKANLAINLMLNLNSIATTDKHKNAKIVSAKILSNKDVIFKTVNKGTAIWLSNKKEVKAFTV